MKRPTTTILVVLIALAVIGFFLYQNNSFHIPDGDTVPLSEVNIQSEEKRSPSVTAEKTQNTTSLQTSREVFITDGVKHTIPLQEMRQGCFGRDCIPSVDNPVFISADEADEIFREANQDVSIVTGIGLAYEGERRFYPFNMLVTREIVNDIVAGQPVLVTYCPLCGTGIVFDRVIDGTTLEFGVSGLLWQSNLLMYNRDTNEDNISLWSQVLGEAVFGEHTGQKLRIIPSDVVRYSQWKKSYPNTIVLNTGRIGDPYNGDYYSVARNFRPNFDEDASPLWPTAYVYGIGFGNEFKAYADQALPVGITSDIFAGKEIRIQKNEDGTVRMFADGNDTPLPVVTGFWFSWVAAHPDTELYE